MFDEILFQDIVENTDYSFSYLIKLFRKYNMPYKIILNREDIIELLEILRNDINTQKKYKLYIYLKTLV